jgi:hypothetical protein
MRHASMTRASTVRSVIAYQARDLVRSRWLAAYTLFFLVASEGLLRYGGGASKALLSLGSIVLFVVPLVTAVFGTVYVYNSRDYTELLLAQPVRRGSLYAGLYLGFTLPLCLAVLVGIAARRRVAHRNGAGNDRHLRRDRVPHRDLRRGSSQGVRHGGRALAACRIAV